MLPQPQVVVEVALTIQALLLKMIRLADFRDTRVITDLLRDFLQETAYEQASLAANDFEHLAKVIWTVQQHGRIWLAYKEEQPQGLLMATVNPNMWYPQARELRELVFYVRPQVRNSTLAGRLFKEFCDYGDQLRAQGRIQGYFTTRMSTTTDFGLERRGFRLVEQTYLKE